MKAIADLRLADIMSPRVLGVTAETSIVDAAGRMRDGRISCLVIRQGERLDGIITERDMVRYVTEHVDLATSVGRLMSTPVVTAPASLDIRAAYELLSQHQVRHLVAVGPVGEILGVVSETDFRTPLGMEVFRSSRDLASVMEHSPIACAPEESLAVVIRRMNQALADYALAVVDGKAVGILTERDVPALVADGADIDRLSLLDVMSTPVESVPVGATVVEALRRMDRHGYRHMAVIGTEGRLVGVVSQHRLLERLGLEIIESAWREREALDAERATLEGRLSMVLDMTGVGVWEYDFSRDSFVWSASVAAMLHRDERDLPRSSEDWLTWMAPEDHERVLAVARTAFTSDAVFEAECRVRSAGSEWLWVRFRGRVLVREACGRAVRAAGTVVDVSSQHASEAALEAERVRMRTLVDTLPDLVWLKDLNGAYLVCNPVFEQFVGAGESEIVGRTDFDFVPAEQAMMFRDRDRAAIAAGGPVSNREWITFASDGRQVLLETIKTPMHDGAGRLIGVLGIGRDVTDDHLMQSALGRRVKEIAALYEIFRETERSDCPLSTIFRRVVSLLPGGMRDPETVLAALAYDGESYGATLAEGCAVFAVRFDGDRGVLRVARRSSSSACTGDAFDSDEKAFVGAIAERVAGAIERISEAAALRDREEVFSAIVGQARDGIVMVDAESMAFVEFNEAACAGLGYSRDEFSAMTLADIQATQSRQQVVANIAQMLLVGGGELKVSHLRKDGSVRITRVSARVVIVRSRPCLVLIWVDITEQERIGAEMRMLRERFELAFQASPVAASIARLGDGLFIDVNNKFTRDFGWPREALVGRSSVECGIWQIEQDRLDWLATLVRDNGVIDYPARWQDMHGRVRDVSISAQMIDIDGLPHILAFVADVTDRLAAEAALRDSEQRFRSLFEDIPQIAVQGYDEARRVVFWNSASERLYGFTESEALGCRLEDLIIPPAIRDDVVCLHAAWLESGRTIPAGELDLMRKDGTLVPVYSSHAMLHRPDGRREMYCVDIDLTQVREAESRLRENEASYRALVAALSEGVLMLGADAAVLTCNPRAQHILGRGADSLIGQSLFERDWGFLDIDGAPLPLAVSPVAEVIGGRRTLDRYVVGYRHPDGGRRWLEINAGPLSARQTDGRPAAAVLSLVDVTARREAEEAVRKLSLAVEQSPNAVLITDRKSRIEYVNEAFVRISGYSREEVLGRRPNLWRSGETPPQTYDALRAALARDQPWSGEFINLNKRGERRIDFVHISPVRQADGRVTHYLSIQEDITDRKRIGEELERHRYHLEEMVRERTVELESAKDVAEAANRAKSSFLANMSHEIRTPMNAIIGLTHLLQREVADARQLDHLRKVSDSARHLLAIINDILDLSKIEAEKILLEARNFRLDAVFDNVLNMLAERCAEKGLAMQVVLDPALPAVLCGDALRLGQILLNFAGNAVKFTERGAVTLRGRCVADRDGSVLVRFEVEDTGIGIDEAAKSRLFETFEQADVSTTRRFGGTGLGLAINKRLSALMGGEVGFESEPGQGSTFWFTAKLSHASLSETESSALASAQDSVVPAPETLAKFEQELADSCSGARILVAEDNAVNREVALSLMADLGFSIDCAENGRQAVEMVGRSDYDLIFMDMQMPEMDGVEATREIRNGLGKHQVPIIALTANAYDDDRQRCLEAGMNGHVAKPVEPATLFAALRRWLPPRRLVAPATLVTSLHGRASSPTADVAEALIARLRGLAGVDVSAGLHRMRQRPTSYARLIYMFADGHRDDVGKLRELLAQGGYEAAGRLAHSLKGAAGMLGAVAIQEQAAALEAVLRAEAGEAQTDQHLAALNETLQALLATVENIRRDDGKAFGH